MLSPLRGWRIAVQYHFLNGHSSCGDAVICRVEQFSTPNKRNFKRSAQGRTALPEQCKLPLKIQSANAVETEQT